MPELPEVETVRRGLANGVVGRTLQATRVLHPRATRRHEPGPDAFAVGLDGRQIASIDRRGKFLWFTFADHGDALVAHLGMSGQFRILVDADGLDSHVRASWQLDDGRLLAFRDQRTFGWLLLSPWTTGQGGDIPTAVSHIGRDPFDPDFDSEGSARALAKSHASIKRGLLNQRHVSGIGNIYADEALWRAQVHPDTPASVLQAEGCRRVIAAATEVMTEALAVGGTSFDPLYVTVNGDLGWFARSLDAYGREGQPCRRCAAAIQRQRFTNRSSHFCATCQTLAED